MSETKDSKFFSNVWKWLRWVLLAALVIIIIIIIIWGLPWIANQFQKPAQTDNQEVLGALATIVANQQAIDERLNDLEATPVPTDDVKEVEEAVEALTSTPVAPEVTEVVTEEVVEALELKTAADIRAFGRVIGWVTGGSEGQFVQGAQVSLKKDWALNTLPSGYVFEYECVHYVVINDEVHASPVCDGGLVRMDTDTIISKGTVGTLWAPNAITAPLTEEWEEGFLDEPCLCADGDCRDE